MGGIPKELGALVKLEELALFDNYLTSTIPKELCINLTLLQLLDLAENQLVGSIPEEIGSMVQLVWLALYENRLIQVSKFRTLLKTCSVYECVCL